ncbi:MAG TPA: hypothetical protein VF748_07490 [Candidatus Acidoferrum sp.]
MNTPTDESLSGQQIHAISAKASGVLQETVNSMGLRRQCVEMAIRVCEGNPDAVVQLAGDLYDFITKPATEVIVHINPP